MWWQFSSTCCIKLGHSAVSMKTTHLLSLKRCIVFTNVELNCIDDSWISHTFASKVVQAGNNRRAVKIFAADTSARGLALTEANKPLLPGSYEQILWLKLQSESINSCYLRRASAHIQSFLLLNVLIWQLSNVSDCLSAPEGGDYDRATEVCVIVSVCVHAW